MSIVHVDIISLTQLCYCLLLMVIMIVIFVSGLYIRDQSGITVRVKVVKNKVAPPFQSIEMDINFGSGIDRLGCLVDAAESTGILVRKGSWYYYGKLESLILIYYYFLFL